jgi:hypothetical protein
MFAVGFDYSFRDLSSTCFHGWAVFGLIGWAVADPSILPELVVRVRTKPAIVLAPNHLHPAESLHGLVAAFVPGTAVELSFVNTDALVGTIEIRISIEAQIDASDIHSARLRSL